MNSNRTGSTQVRFLVAAAFVVMAGTGYAVSTSGVVVEGDARIAIPAIPAAEHAQSYFPAQYVNQAVGAAEEHIQAF